MTLKVKTMTRSKVWAALLAPAALGAMLSLARSADGQEPPVRQEPPPAADAGIEPVEAPGPSSPVTADAGAPPPTPPPGYMLVPIPADAGAPEGGAAGGVPPSVATGAGADLARFRHANTWDLNLEGGGGYVFGGVDKWTGFVRARPGVLIVRNDDFYQFGPTVEYLGMLKRPAFGAQVEYLHLQLGTWAQLGGSIDTKGRPGLNAALGLSVFGVEAQVREFDATGDLAFALLGKIRLPLGILVYGLRTKK